MLNKFEVFSRLSSFYFSTKRKCSEAKVSSITLSNRRGSYLLIRDFHGIKTCEFGPVYIVKSNNNNSEVIMTH